MNENGVGHLSNCSWTCLKEAHVPAPHSPGGAPAPWAALPAASDDVLFAAPCRGGGGWTAGCAWQPSCGSTAALDVLETRVLPLELFLCPSHAHGRLHVAWGHGRTGARARLDQGRCAWSRLLPRTDRNSVRPGAWRSKRDAEGPAPHGRVHVTVLLLHRLCPRTKKHATTFLWNRSQSIVWNVVQTLLSFCPEQSSVVVKQTSGGATSASRQAWRRFR